MRDAKTLIELRKRAEKAVEGMPDGDLKVKAFEVILARLLEATVPATPAGSAGSSRQPGQPAKARPNGVPKATGERIVALQRDKFFSQQRTIAEIQEALRSHGWHYPQSTLSGPLQSFVQQKKLRRERAKLGNKKI